MRALLLAFLLALTAAAPAFADEDGGSEYRSSVLTVDSSNPWTWAP